MNATAILREWVFLIRRFISCPCLGQSKIHKENLSQECLGPAAGRNNPGRFFHHNEKLLSDRLMGPVLFFWSLPRDNCSSRLHVRSWGPRNPLFVQVSYHGKAVSSRLYVEASQEITYLCSEKIKLLLWNLISYGHSILCYSTMSINPLFYMKAKTV